MIIKILQWNFLYKESPDNIIELIKKCQPDIVCGQELITNSHNKKFPKEAEYIADKIAYSFFYHEADTWSPPKYGKESQGNAIFSRYPINSKRFEYLYPAAHNPKNAMSEGRVYLEIKINFPNSKLVIGTTHLSFFPKFIVEQKRAMELNKLEFIIRKKRKNYLLTGDFNATPDSLIVKTILKYLKNAGPELNLATWTTKPFDYHGLFKANKLRWRLDYIFKTADLKVVSAKIINTDYSDHLPILISIDI